MPAPLDQQLRRARMAVFVLFLTNGALFANIIPRYPEVKDVFGLSESVYGLTIALYPLGALLSGPFAAVVIRRFSSASTAVIGTIGIGSMLSVVGALTMWREGLGQDAGALGLGLYLAFASFFLLAGACDSVTDVGQNAHGLRVQRLMGRPIINNFHAGWSIGAMLGGLMGALATALAIPLGWHLLGSALIFVLVGAVALRFTLPGADPARGEIDPIVVDANVLGATEATVGEDVVEMSVRTLPLKPALVVGALTLLAIAGMLMEDAAATWSTLFMRDYIGVGPAIAGSAFIVMLGSQAVGRLSADWQMERFGAATTVRLGATLVAVGMGIAVAWPSALTTLIGMAAAGFGCAAIVPVAYNAADDIPGLRPGTGLTVVTWLGRLAFLGAPPLVGLLVESTSLLSAMVVIPVAGLVAALTSLIVASDRGARTRV